MWTLLGIGMVVDMGVKTRRERGFTRVSMQAHHRRPSELERNDEHEDESCNATHAGHCTYTPPPGNMVYSYVAFVHDWAGPAMLAA
jgi:hypothetical protein